VKSLVELLVVVFSDVEKTLSVDLQSDVKTLRRRVEREGDSFITITLPNFCRDFERSLDNGRVGPGSFLSFGKIGSGIPAFLQGLLSNVFDHSGSLRQCPSIDCIRSIRQLCLFGKKVERPCTSARSSAAVDGYWQCDRDLVAPQGQLWRWFGLVSDVIVSDLPGLRDINLDILRPRHGPGATRESISGNQKWVFRRWHERLEAAGFTIRRFARGSPSDPSPDEGWEPPYLVPSEEEQPVKVTLVPKTQKSPRVIAVEPVCMQYAQQALKALLVDGLGKSRFTRGLVNFTDQSVNQKLAQACSRSRKSATLDMSDASDRVGLWHAERLFRKAPEFWRLAEAARSRRAVLPSGQLVDLQKFASMGSALCFPVEALVFFVSIIASRLCKAGLFPTARRVKEFSRGVYVFGDDLIIPSDEALSVSADLEALGFKVNRHKSFWTGQFRESCGSDCYDGEYVTPTYLRRDLPDSRGDANRLLSTVSTANQFYQSGYRLTATALRAAVEEVVGSLPQVPVDSPAVGWHFEVTAPRLSTRWNAELQRRETYVLVAFQADSPDEISGDSALAKALFTCGMSSLVEPLKNMSPTREDHLMVSPSCYALKLKRSWVYIAPRSK
jgi:hypothetical protein